MRMIPIILLVIFVPETVFTQLQQPVYIGDASWIKAATNGKPRILPVTRHKMWMNKIVNPNEPSTFKSRKIDPETKILKMGATVPAKGSILFKNIPLPVPQISEAPPLLTRDNADFNVNYTDKQHGFAGTTTSDFAEDNAHHIWIASETGLIKYDGYHYYVYPQTNLFPSTEINSLVFDSQKRLWIGTSKGLFFLQDDSLYAASSKDVDFENSHYFKVQEDKQQRIWVSAKQIGAICISQNKIEVYDTRCGLPNNYAFYTFIDQHNNLYIALWNSGIVIIEKDKMRNLFASMPGPSTGISMIRSVIEDEKGVWMGTYTHGLLCMKPNDTIQYTMNGKYTDRIYDLKTAPKGIWVSIYGVGVNYLGDNHLFSVGGTTGLVSRNAYFMLKDSFQNLWIADLSGGFSRLNENLFYQLPLPNKGTQNIEKRIQDDKKGTWTFTSGSGLWYQQGSTSTQYMNKLANGVAGIYYPIEGKLNKDGSLWMVGYDGEGIMYGKGQDFVCYKYTDFREYGIILSMQEDDTKKLWFSTMFYGVISYDNQVFRHYTTSSGLRDLFPKKLYLDAENKVCCSFKSGFQRFSKDTIQNFFIGDSLFTKQVNHFFVKDAATSFMAVNNHGLYVIHKKKVYLLSTSQGLASNNIQSIAMDAGKKIWVTTDKGIEYFDFNDNTLTDHKFFNQSNGAFVSNAGIMLQDSLGNPYWTSLNKQLRYNPIFEKRQKIAPQFSITQIQVDGKKIPTNKKISILPNQKININFTAIYWGRENNLNIKYLLISSDGDTTLRSVGTKGNILLSEIQPDDYKIVLLAEDNNINYFAPTLEVEVRNFWYNTWIFRLIMIGLLVASIIIYYRMKSARQLAMNEMLEKKVAEQTEEILKEKEYLEKSNKIIDQQVREKDVLIQEINHRVKNNLQFMTAMVEMQIRASGKKDTTKSLMETNRRINAMSLVHEMLYDNSKKIQGLSIKNTSPNWLITFRKWRVAKSIPSPSTWMLLIFLWIPGQRFHWE